MLFSINVSLLDHILLYLQHSLKQITSPLKFLFLSTIEPYLLNYRDFFLLLLHIRNAIDLLLSLSPAPSTIIATHQHSTITRVKTQIVHVIVYFLAADHVPCELFLIIKLHAVFEKLVSFATLTLLLIKLRQRDHTIEGVEVLVAKEDVCNY